MDMNEILPDLEEEFAQQIRIREEYMPRTVIFPDLPKKILVAIGMRRVGKTHVLFQQAARLLATDIALERIMYVNFEDDRFIPHTRIQLSGLIDAFYHSHPDNHHQP